METNEEVSMYLLSVIPKVEIERVFSSDTRAEICGDFLGFVNTYFHLSKIIPKDFIIIDIGCGYNAQSYLFNEFQRVYAVNPLNEISGFHFEYFCAPNCTLFDMTAGEFIEQELPKLNLDLKKCFAICNYVPNWHNEKPMKLVAKTFPNHYVFYPKKTNSHGRYKLVKKDSK